MDIWSYMLGRKSGGGSGGGGGSISLQNKNITENGEYTADEGYDGLGKVTVDVAGSGGGGGSSGGDVKVTTGTIVPLANTCELVHGLGVVPDYVIFYIEDTTKETSSTSIRTYAQPETVVGLESQGSGYSQSLFAAFRVKDRHLSRTTFSLSGSTNWGYYAVSDVVDRLWKPMQIDENRLYQSQNYPMIPYSTDGAITIRWFAIAGVA